LNIEDLLEEFKEDYITQYNTDEYGDSSEEE